MDSVRQDGESRLKTPGGGDKEAIEIDRIRVAARIPC